MSERNAVIVDGPLLTHRWIDDDGDACRYHVDLRAVDAVEGFPGPNGERRVQLICRSGEQRILRLESDFQAGLVVSSWEQVKKAEGAAAVTEINIDGSGDAAVEKALRSIPEEELKRIVRPPIPTHPRRSATSTTEGHHST